MRKITTLFGRQGEPRRLPQVRFVTELGEGEDWRLLPDGTIVITHPDRVPQIIPPGEQRLLPP